MIIALDPSLSNTAVLLGDSGGGYKMRTFRSLRIGDDARSRITRYRGLVHQIMRWLGDAKPDAVFIEGYSFGSNDYGAKWSAEYGGLLRVRLVDMAPRIWEIAPATLKKFASGRGRIKKEAGRSSKQPVIERLRARYGVQFASSDEYDAFALYRIGLAVLGLAEPIDRAQAEVVEQLLHPQPKKRKSRRPRTAPRRTKEKTLF